MEIQWLTTVPSGRSNTHAADQGQTGWRLHAVPADSNESALSVRRRRALCGLLPARGWGLDLFIERKCARCEAKAR